MLDTEGKELAATGEVDKNCSDAVLAFVESPADSQVIQGRQFFKIFDEQRLEYVLVANGDSEGEYMLGKIAACLLYTSWLKVSLHRLTSVNQVYSDRMQAGSFRYAARIL